MLAPVSCKALIHSRTTAVCSSRGILARWPLRTGLLTCNALRNYRPLALAEKPQGRRIISLSQGIKRRT